MKNAILFLSFITLLFSAFACTQAPDYEDVPFIEFVSFNKNTLLQGMEAQDTIFMTIDFEDGDGDLGGNGTPGIFARDTRIANPTPLQFSIPELPELGSENGISGQMEIMMFSTCCIQGQTTCQPFEDTPEQELIYEVYITDQAGNESNKILTSPIRLICN